MTPASLTPGSFAAYPPAGREFARRHLGVLRSIPLAVLPGFLEQIRSYDWSFPNEQTALTRQLEWLENANADERGQLFLPFAAITLPSDLTASDWVNDPQEFTQGHSAHLWQSRQIDGYRAAAVELFRAMPTPAAPSQPALVVAIIGRDAPVSSYPLFTHLRRQGLYARNVSTEDARDALLGVLVSRAQAAPEPYAHWYVDGGDAWPLDGECTRFDHSLHVPAACTHQQCGTQGDGRSCAAGHRPRGA